MNAHPYSLLQGIAGFQSQALGALLSSDNDDLGFMDILGQLQGMDVMHSPLAYTPASTAGRRDMDSLLAAGRNMALPDPESAYRMMTDINNRDVYFKAQYAELSEMQSDLIELEDVGADLAAVDLTSTTERIQADLQGFVADYNAWIQRFEEDLRDDGLLADTRAAEVARYELEQSVNNRFYGTHDGLNGLRDLGVTIDPVSHLASLDVRKLDAVMASNKQGVVNVVDAFSAHFAKSADLLNAENSFVPRQLDNLKRGIAFIADNKADLQVEFGTGAPAKPSGKIAEALAAYQRSYATVAA